MDRRRLQVKYSCVVYLAIMTSDDTHDRTIELLNANKFFGFPREHVVFMKQEKVAALLDNDARIAQVDPYEVRGRPTVQPGRERARRRRDGRVPERKWCSGL